MMMEERMHVYRSQINYKYQVIQYFSFLELHSLTKIGAKIRKKIKPQQVNSDLRVGLAFYRLEDKEFQIKKFTKSILSRKKTHT
jgi:hypothetical protein